jgi:hypothetical protein
MELAATVTPLVDEAERRGLSPGIMISHWARGSSVRKSRAAGVVLAAKVTTTEAVKELAAGGLCPVSRRTWLWVA